MGHSEDLLDVNTFAPSTLMVSVKSLHALFFLCSLWRLPSVRSEITTLSFSSFLLRESYRDFATDYSERRISICTLIFKVEKNAASDAPLESQCGQKNPVVELLLTKIRHTSQKK